jgi:hypothetical protein
MKVKIRHIEAAESVPFGEAKNECELQEMIRFIGRSGGVYMTGEDTFPFHSYQLVLDEGEFFAELLIGADDD